MICTVYCDLFICGIFTAHIVTDNVDYLIEQLHYWVIGEKWSDPLSQDLCSFTGLEAQ